MYNNYFELDKMIDKLYDAEKYEEVVELLDEAAQKLPKEEAKKYQHVITFNQARFRTNCGKYDECMDILIDLVEKGFVCPLYWDRFIPLKQDSRFHKMNEKNNQLLKEAQENSQLKYEVFLPQDYNKNNKCPLFFVLHGDGMNMDEFIPYWDKDVFLNNGFILVYVQSSQVAYFNGFSWVKDPLIARRDIKHCYETITKEYSIDKDSVMIGGFSGGATTAVDITFDQTIPIKGFIALCPEIKPASFSEDNVKSAVQLGVKGIFMEGELMMPVQEEEEMAAVFEAVGLPFDYYINTGIGHSVPEDFTTKLEKALKFVL